ncbi:Aste57867_17989 [Aphanomyces stellatus]|uniref:Aste57867_17989 protein n=1 Tax=Aphanomyces stellatus TaxID=120398 RepID=A0A485LAM2_9STRA|nr:hypothetical protein As57867_017927 [Aphanomyces stellatus]VFT94728.1 Aste57867_17989 [Aphanomyces stellatus]
MDKTLRQKEYRQVVACSRSTPASRAGLAVGTRILSISSHPEKNLRPTKDDNSSPKTRNSRKWIKAVSAPEDDITRICLVQIMDPASTSGHPDLNRTLLMKRSKYYENAVISLAKKESQNDSLSSLEREIAIVSKMKFFDETWNSDDKFMHELDTAI